MRLLYFAWLRERIGLAEEEVDLPIGVETVEDLMTWLRKRSPAHAHAFAASQIVRAAIDRIHVKPTACVRTAREVAFFPPMTGG